MESFTSLKRIFKKKNLKSDQKAEGEKGGGVIAIWTQVNYADENLKKPWVSPNRFCVNSIWKHLYDLVNPARGEGRDA